MRPRTDYVKKSRRIVDQASSVLATLENASSAIAGIAAVIMMVLVGWNTVGRYLFDSPLRGTNETIAEYLMVAIVWLGVSHTERIGRHPAVSALADMVSRRNRLV